MSSNVSNFPEMLAKSWTDYTQPPGGFAPVGKVKAFEVIPSANVIFETQDKTELVVNRSPVGVVLAQGIRHTVTARQSEHSAGSYVESQRKAHEKRAAYLPKFI